MCRHRCILLLFASSLVMVSYAQETKKIISKGISITRDISPLEAKFRAIEDAKINALKKAGISEEISLSNFLHTTQVNNNFNQSFNEISTSEINGAITIDTILSESRKFDEYNNMIIEVEILSNVYKYSSKSDPDFTFKVENIRDVYYSGEYLKFNFTPTRDGYLKVFNIADDNAFVLYPYENEEVQYLSDEKARLFKANKEVLFPVHPAYKKGYKIHINENKKEEINLLIFFYTKTVTPFYKRKNYKDILQYIYEIPPEKRSISYINVLIKR